MIAFIYGGQGSQRQGIGKDLYDEYPQAKSFYDEVEIGFDLKQLSFKASLDEVSKTKYTQAILLAHQLVVTDILKAQGIEPSIAMGLSLGEYGALYAAGAYDRDKAMDIIEYRAQQMSLVEDLVDSAMAALLTDDLQLVEETLDKVSDDNSKVEISNINTRGQIVISGEKNAVEKAIQILSSHKIRSISLNTSGAFHTSYMDSVEEDLRTYLKDVKLDPLKIPVVFNRTGSLEENQDIDIKELLSQQVSNTVQFKKSLEYLLSLEPKAVIEIGYGGIVASLIRRIDRKIRVISVSDRESIEQVVNMYKEGELIG